MRSQIIFTLLLQSSAFLCSGQQKRAAEELFYLWNAEWKSTTKADSAAYLSRLRKLDDTCWEMDTWRYAGPMVASEQYRDQLTQIANGIQYYYYPSGYVDSTGYMADGVPDGDWSYNDSNGTQILTKHYQRGQLLTTYADSSSFHDFSVPGEFESSFPGGLTGWRKYLNKKMDFPDRALKLGVTGEVVVQFVVNEYGVVEAPVLHKSLEYSIDQVALSIIGSSPLWKPSTKDGRTVRSFKRQPLIFRTQGQ